VAGTAGATVFYQDSVEQLRDRNDQLREERAALESTITDRDDRIDTLESDLSTLCSDSANQNKSVCDDY
jgi:chaperonin cofactor prefoldin